MTSLTALLTRTVLRNTAWAAAALASWALVAGQAPVSGDVAAPVPAEIDRVALLVERHACWGGTAPAGAPDPTRAVVTGTDGRTRLVAAKAGYDIWLGDLSGSLHAFCP